MDKVKIQLNLFETGEDVTSQVVKEISKAKNIIQDMTAYLVEKGKDKSCHTIVLGKEVGHVRPLVKLFQQPTGQKDRVFAYKVLGNDLYAAVEACVDSALIEGEAIFKSFIFVSNGSLYDLYAVVDIDYTEYEDDAGCRTCIVDCSAIPEDEEEFENLDMSLFFFESFWFDDQKDCEVLNYKNTVGSNVMAYTCPNQNKISALFNRIKSASKLASTQRLFN